MGEFDQLIQQELMRNRSQRGDEPNQRARDFAARQMNARAGNAPSTAWPSEPVATRGGGGASGGGAIQQSQVPIPTSRPSSPMANAVDAQMATEMGDGSVMEAMNGAPRTVPIPDDMGDASVAEQMSPLVQSVDQQVAYDPLSSANPGDIEATEVPGAPDEPEGGNGALIGTIAAGLGTAGIAKLIHSYRMGDPKADAFFKSTGISPDDLSMFADDLDPSRAEGGVRPAPSESSKQTQPSRAKPSPTQVQKPNQKPRSQAPAVKPKTNAQVKGNVNPKTNIGPDHPRWNFKPKVKVK